jgi:hypothetical protein
MAFLPRRITRGKNENNVEVCRIHDHEFNNEVQHADMGNCRTRGCGAWPEGNILYQRRSEISGGAEESRALRAD